MQYPFSSAMHNRERRRIHSCPGYMGYFATDLGHYAYGSPALASLTGNDNLGEYAWYPSWANEQSIRSHLVVTYNRDDVEIRGPAW